MESTKVMLKEYNYVPTIGKKGMLGPLFVAECNEWPEKCCKRKIITSLHNLSLDGL